MADQNKNSSDIYEVNESPWLKQQQEAQAASKHRRRRRSKSFDEATTDVSSTHRRRRGNSGFRRFVHLMRKPEYSKKFWMTTLGVFFSIVLAILVWDLWFRYPDPEADYTEDVYRAIVPEDVE